MTRANIIIPANPASAPGFSLAVKLIDTLKREPRR